GLRAQLGCGRRPALKVQEDHAGGFTRSMRRSKQFVESRQPRLVEEPAKQRQSPRRQRFATGPTVVKPPRTAEHGDGAHAIVSRNQSPSSLTQRPAEVNNLQCSFSKTPANRPCSRRA